MARGRKSRNQNEIAADEEIQNRSNLPGRKDLAHHLALISAAKQKKSDADMKLASAYALAEECGLDRKAIKALLKIRDQDAEKTKSEFQTVITYMRWMEMPVGKQLHFFDNGVDDPEASARAEGRAAGLEGASANTNPYPTESKLEPIWEAGRQEAQAELAGKIGKTPAKPKAEAPTNVASLATERKKRGPKPKTAKSDEETAETLQ